MIRCEEKAKVGMRAGAVAVGSNTGGPAERKLKFAKLRRGEGPIGVYGYRRVGHAGGRDASCTRCGLRELSKAAAGLVDGRVTDTDVTTSPFCKYPLRHTIEDK